MAFLMKKNFWPVFILLAGVMIGVVLTTEFRLPPFGEATNTTRESSPLPANVPFDQVFVEISKRVTPAVVNISTTRMVKGDEGASPFFDDPFFRRFFGDESRRPGVPPRERKEQSLGSGVIVDPRGYIITNNHVVSKADEINVLMGDRREFKGKLVGSDPKSDIAVVKVEAKDLPTIPWADSTHLQVGEYVLAIGNSFGLNQTVTMGIVSAVGRANVGIADYEDFIQTDAAINPGNSGGALVNIRGELIGINTAIFTRSGGYMGIGFAVPSNMARSVMDSLIKTGKVVRGWLGISIQEVTPKLAKEFGLPEAKGALVGEVLPKSPAERAGLKRGDILLEVNGKPIENTGQLRNLVADIPVGHKVKIKFFRDQKTQEIEATIEEQPKEIGKQPEKGEESPEPTSNALSGVEVRNLTPEITGELGLPSDVQGVVVDRIETGSSAEEAGLQRGDVIIEVNRVLVRDIKEYNRAASKIKKDQSILLLVQRQGRSIFLTISP